MEKPLDRFNLEGWTYYQQGRKCGNPDCKCARGELHGPYWYKRNISSGTVFYIGKNLPGDIAAARTWHDLLLSDMVKRRRILATMFDAMTRLMKNEALSPQDRQIIQYLGFGQTLVSPAVDQVAQDYVTNNLIPPLEGL